MNTIKNEELPQTTPTTKTEWVKPEIQLIDKTAIQGFTFNERGPEYWGYRVS